MKIKKLLKNIPAIQVKGSKELEITGISLHSKGVAPGHLFIARRGAVYQGAHYIPEAIAAGAMAIATDMYDPRYPDVTQLIYPKGAHIEGLLAANFYKFPSDELLTIGITGTNGKTTTSFFIKSLLEHLDIPCGLIGTVEYVIGSHRYQALRTTPDVCSNHRMLREMVHQGCKAVVMEVASHALVQKRVEHIDFDIAIFTNLTLDHLDYHLSMENYAKAKQKLFLSLNAASRKKEHPFSKTAVINSDSPWAHRMIEGISTEILTYGLESQADLQASDIEFSANGTQFRLSYKGESAFCKSSYVGRYNIYNYMAALAVGLLQHIPLQEVVDCFSVMPKVPGRLERIDNPLGFKVYVDFAHTDDALINVLQCLREIKKDGRLIVVFGCGGDRDASKRPKMAEACEKFADMSIVTSDNPRSEDIEQICRDILKGFMSKESYLVELDRKKAIEKAMRLATANDLVLIAGKGHERTQIFAHRTIEFDDCQEAASACQKIYEESL